MKRWYRLVCLLWKYALRVTTNRALMVTIFCLCNSYGKSVLMNYVSMAIVVTQLLSLPHKPVLKHCIVMQDRKSTRLNSSHVRSSYAVFCLKKKTRDPGRAPGAVQG